MSTAFICSVNRELFFFDVMLLSVLKKVSLTLRHIINDIEQNLRQVSFAGHRSQAIVLPIQKVSQTLLKANLRPKTVCLGLIRPKVSLYKCLGYFLYW